MNEKKYLLIDSGNQKKLEKVGEYFIIRPSLAAIWNPALKEGWEKADAIFLKEDKNFWKLKKKIKESWLVEIEGIVFKVSLTNFGHLGIFPEQSVLWKEMVRKIEKRKNPNILNLFAYTGGASLFLAKKGASVCHVDASKPSILWGKENAKLNKLEKAPIRWIVEDVKKFLKREIRRGVKYDGIILDPPTFGRGPKNEVFKIEKDIFNILEMCKNLLSKNPLFLLLSSHTPGFSKVTLENLLKSVMKEGKIKKDDMFLKSLKSFNIPSGCYAMWEK
jgi:23S rRNA (cytosine1962-C5)-methyltransferase